MTPEIQRMRRQAIESMVHFMKYGGAESESDPDFDPQFDAGYTQEHVDECAGIIDAYLATVSAITGVDRDRRILDAVKSVVLALNALNDRCDGTLIETDQREELCPLIIAAARLAGLTADQYDVTEEWREW